MTATVNQGVQIAALSVTGPLRTNQGAVIAAVSFLPPNSPPQVNQGFIIAAVRQFPVVRYTEINPAIILPCIASCGAVSFFSRTVRMDGASPTYRAMMTPVESNDKWRVAVAAGVTEDYNTPDQACRRMHQRFNPSAQYNGYELRPDGKSALCKWTGPGTAPTSVFKIT